MASQLTQFNINGLHGLKTIEVPIKDNKLVLVGENGTGKSTLATFIYLFLTQQWGRMLEYEFSSISAVVNSDELSMTKEDVETAHLSRQSRRHLGHGRIPPSVARRLEQLVADHEIEDFMWDAELVERMVFETGLPRSLLMDYLVNLSVTDRPVSENTDHIVKVLRSSELHRVLFLPTYRRIEQDLRSIFHGPESEFERFRDRFTRRARSSSHLELVEFGMEDVEKTIKRRMEAIKDNVRNGLNNLTGTYLRDVIRGDYQLNNISVIHNLNEQTVNDIFSRLDEVILPLPEQQRLRGIIATIKTNKPIQEDEKVIVHFLIRLTQLYEAQQQSEENVQEFVRVCNKYLVGKEIIYDNLNFGINIHEVNSSRDRLEAHSPREITLRMLSSGEKQIVSLFSHIYLSDSRNYFVIIDEPELSLSVPWQRQFLPDILNTAKCSGLIAVTHSPFIFDNELESYTHSLEEFTEPVNVVS